jgi:hypothetical protein
LNTLQMQIYRLKFPSNKGSNGEKSKRCAWKERNKEEKDWNKEDKYWNKKR